MKRIVAFMLILALLTGTTVALAAAGGAEDPLVSLSYITDYLAVLMNKADQLIETKLQTLSTSVSARLDTIKIPDATQAPSGFGNIQLDKGTSLSVRFGSSITVLSGTVIIVGTEGTVIDLTSGSIVDEGTILLSGRRYFAAENSRLTAGAYSTASLLVDGVSTQATADALPAVTVFSDISGHWSRTNIEYLAFKGIVNGMGGDQFAPGMTVTRAMFVTMLGRTCGIAASQYQETVYSDVDSALWYGPYVAWAAQLGIVNGIGDGTFRPGQEISREQMATIIVRLCAAMGKTLRPINPVITFPDDALISPYAAEAVAAAQRAGILNGRADGTFDPKGTATRAEVCAVVYRYIKMAA